MLFQLLFLIVPAYAVGATHGMLWGVLAYVACFLLVLAGMVPISTWYAGDPERRLLGLKMARFALLLLVSAFIIWVTGSYTVERIA